MSGQPNVADALRELSSQISVLAVSCLAGAAFRAILSPERKWKRKIVLGAGGAISAVFSRRHSRPCARQPHRRRVLYAFLAAGFIMGSGGESRRQSAAGPYPRGRQMSWLLIANDAGSRWWRSCSAGGWRMSAPAAAGDWASGPLSGYAIVASLIAFTAFDRSTSADFDHARSACRQQDHSGVGVRNNCAWLAC